jgi:hypothetical protein
VTDKSRLPQNLRERSSITPQTETDLRHAKGEERSESEKYCDAQDTASVDVGGPSETERGLQSNFSASVQILPEIVEESDENEYVSASELSVELDVKDSDNRLSKDLVILRFNEKARIESPASIELAENMSGEESDADSWDNAHNDEVCGGSRPSKCQLFSHLGSVGSLIQDEPKKLSTADAAKCNKQVIKNLSIRRADTTRADDRRVESKSAGNDVHNRKESPAHKMNEFMKTFYGESGGSEEDDNDYSIDDDEERVNSNRLVQVNDDDDDSEIDLLCLASKVARDGRVVPVDNSPVTACAEPRDQKSAAGSQHSLFDGEDFVSKSH